MFRKPIILILTVYIFRVDISYSQAKIDFVETTFDFGQIEEGTFVLEDYTDNTSNHISTGGKY